MAKTKYTKEQAMNPHNKINNTIYCGYYPNGLISLDINGLSVKLTVREAGELAKSLVSCIGSVCTAALEKNDAKIHQINENK